ncbi:MAG: hypothetical protein Q8O70_11590, partial [Burkholderiales bacterium]|nr:hypothetical protein [Burkholderiales bacterium]
QAIPLNWFVEATVSNNRTICANWFTILGVADDNVQLRARMKKGEQTMIMSRIYAIALATLAFGIGTAAAQGFPSKSVRILEGFAPG